MRQLPAAPEVPTPNSIGGSGGPDLDRLPRTPITELRRLWVEHIGARTPPPRQRRALIRELAWRVQERRYGGLDAETAHLLKLAIRRASQSLRGRAPAPEKASFAALPATTRTGGTRGTAVAKGLSTSSRLLRKWRGRTHEVEVLGGGGTRGGNRFRYQGQEFKSLSEIARHITGVHWSGPRFFGLTNRRKSKEESEA